MSAALALSMLLVAAPGADAAQEPEWEVAATSKGVTVMQRERRGSALKEVKAVGEVDAPARAVFRLLRDYARYTEIMPYTEESRVVAVEGSGKVIHFYSRINAPLVSRRDYTMRIVDTTDPGDAQGRLSNRWTPSDKGPAPEDGVVRVAVNEGSWLVEPLGEARCRATYALFTDPGGNLPTWIKNSANSSAIPDMFEAIRKHALEPRYADQDSHPKQP